MRVLTDDLVGCEANILHGTVEEGEAGLGARAHVYFLFHHGVHAHLTIRIGAHFLQMQGQVFAVGEIHCGQHYEGTQSTRCSLKECKSSRLNKEK